MSEPSAPADPPLEELCSELLLAWARHRPQAAGVAGYHQQACDSRLDDHSDAATETWRTELERLATRVRTLGEALPAAAEARPELDCVRGWLCRELMRSRQIDPSDATLGLANLSLFTQTVSPYAPDALRFEALVRRLDELTPRLAAVRDRVGAACEPVTASAIDQAQALAKLLAALPGLLSGLAARLPWGSARLADARAAALVGLNAHIEWLRDLPAAQLAGVGADSFEDWLGSGYGLDCGVAELAQLVAEQTARQETELTRLGGSDWQQRLADSAVSTGLRQRIERTLGELVSHHELSAYFPAARPGELFIAELPAALEPLADSTPEYLPGPVLEPNTRCLLLLRPEQPERPLGDTGAGLALRTAAASWPGAHLYWQQLRSHGSALRACFGDPSAERAWRVYTAVAVAEVLARPELELWATLELRRLTAETALELELQRGGSAAASAEERLVETTGLPRWRARRRLSVLLRNPGQTVTSFLRCHRLLATRPEDPATWKGFHQRALELGPLPPEPLGQALRDC